MTINDVSEIDKARQIRAGLDAEIERLEQTKPVVLTDVSLIFKNFSGKKSEFNAAGNRTFSILIEDPDLADDLARDNWNVKELVQEDAPSQYHLTVKVNFESNYPPRVFIVREDKRLVALGEHNVAMLDYSKIIKAEVAINPYVWEVQRKVGITAYLSSLYVEIESNRLDDKYTDYEVV